MLAHTAPHCAVILCLRRCEELQGYARLKVVAKFSISVQLSYPKIRSLSRLSDTQEGMDSFEVFCANI